MTFDPTSFSAWLTKKASILDRACGAAMREGLMRLTAKELDNANKSLNELYADTSSGVALPGGDCDYSLRGVGALYTGHWHGKRVHDAISVLTALLPILGNTPLHIIDVGAGTGAGLWAWGLIACFAYQKGKPLPVHLWTNMDASNEMLGQGDLLWAKFCREFPWAPQLVNRQGSLCSDWHNRGQLPAGSAVLASYLFSRNDLTNPAASAQQFAEFLTRNTAAWVTIWTKQNKSAVLAQLKLQLSGWNDRTPQLLFECPVQGRMWRCLEAAETRCAALKLAPDTDWPRRFNWGRAPTDAVVLAMTR